MKREDYTGPATEGEEWFFPVPQREFYLVSSPMTGRPELNLPVIRDVITKLGRTGIVAFNPFATYEASALLKYDDHFFTSQYIPVVAHPRCAGVIVLPGWELSDGATREVVLAASFEKPQLVYRVAIDPEDGHAQPHLQLLERESICL